jgi:hypothetical protein
MGKTLLAHIKGKSLFYLCAEWHLLKQQDSRSTWFNQRVLVGQGPTLPFNSGCRVGP